MLFLKLHKEKTKSILGGECLSMNDGRYEIKYLITYADYMELLNKLKYIMAPDEHSSDDYDYFVRSLYYDDLYDSSYTKKINGDNDRRKYRIRTYNMRDDNILFERKEKHNNKVDKSSFTLKRFQYEQLAVGNFDVIKDIDSPIAEEIYGIHCSLGLNPSVIVDYDRTALIHPLSNTRITFDKNLRAGINSFDIFDEDIYTYPIFPNNSVVLEVKYDHQLPAHISSMLGSICGQKTAISKFCMCREKLAHLDLKHSFIY